MKTVKIHRLLSLLLVTGLLAACGESAQMPSETTADSTSAAEETTAGYTLPKADFGGRDVNFYVSDYFSLIHQTEETGDTVNDAVYRRNRKVEEEYNVKFQYTVGNGSDLEFAQWYSTAEASIMAGDGSIDIIAGYFYRMAINATTGGHYQNLMELDAIDFSQPWWIGDLMERSVIGDKLFVTTGNLDPSFYNRIYAMVFNKELADSLGIENLYDTVNAGKWTYDKLKSISKIAARDLNGDSKMDESDQYGYITGHTLSIDTFNSAFDIRFVDYDEDGIPYMLPLPEKLVQAVDDLGTFLMDSGDALYLKEAYIPAPQYTIFEEGRGLVLATLMRELQKMRSFEPDFGILPYPKWDEAQEQYYSNVGVGNTTGYCVPVTTDPELAGCILEALAYYGHTDIYPEYYERTLKAKGARDDDSAAMLDLIFNNIRYEFTQIYSLAFGAQKSPHVVMRYIFQKGGETASTWASNKQLYDESVQNLVDALK